MASLLFCLLGANVATAAEGAHHHQHHLAAVLGGTWKESDKSAGTYGIEYSYRFSQRFALGAWYELASGDFDLDSLGVLGKVYAAESFPILIGVGNERELFGDHKFFLRTGLQYEFQLGQVGIAPAAWIDWVENGKQLYFVGTTVGIGF